MSYFRRAFSSCFGSNSTPGERIPLLPVNTPTFVTPTRATSVPVNKLLQVDFNGPILACNVVKKDKEYKVQIIFANKRNNPIFFYDGNAAIYTYDALDAPFSVDAQGNLMLSPAIKKPEFAFGDNFFVWMSAYGDLSKPGYIFQSNKGPMLVVRAKKDDNEGLLFFKDGMLICQFYENKVIDGLHKSNTCSKIFLLKNACFFFMSNGQLFYIDFNLFFNKDLRVQFQEDKTYAYYGSRIKKISKTLDVTAIEIGETVCVSSLGIRMFNVHNVEAFCFNGEDFFCIFKGQSNVIKYKSCRGGGRRLCTISFTYSSITSFIVSPDENFIAFSMIAGVKSQIKVVRKATSQLVHEHTCDDFFQMDFTNDSKVFYWAEKINDSRKKPYRVNLVAMPSDSETNMRESRVAESAI